MEPQIETLADELEAIRSELVELEGVEAPTEEQVARSETLLLSLIHISEPTRRHHVSRMPSSA